MKKIIKKNQQRLCVVKNWDFKNVSMIDDNDEIEVIPSKEKIDKFTDFTVKIIKNYS